MNGIDSNNGFTFNSDNSGEILGFFHHQLSQQSKDIGLLNRRVAELIQQSKLSDSSTIASFIETNNKRLDGFGASISSLTSQMLLNQDMTNKNIDSFKKNVRNEVKEEIGQINVEIEKIKNQMILSSSQLNNNCIKNNIDNNVINNFDDISNNDSEENESIKTITKSSKKQSNKKANSSKNKHSTSNLNGNNGIKKSNLNENKGKPPPSKILSNISIVDITPIKIKNNNFDDISKEIENLKNEILFLKKNVSADEKSVNDRFLSVNKRIDDFSLQISENVPEKLNLNDENMKKDSNFSLLISKEENIKEILFSGNKNNNSNNIKFNDNLNNEKKDLVYELIEGKNNENNVKEKNIIFNDIFSNEDNEENVVFGKATSQNLNTKFGPCNNNNLTVVMSSGNQQMKSDFSNGIQKNKTPRKTPTHFTLINGDCLKKRPGTQMLSKACKAVKPYPI